MDQERPRRAADEDIQDDRPVEQDGYVGAEDEEEIGDRTEDEDEEGTAAA